MSTRRIFSESRRIGRFTAGTLLNLVFPSFCKSCGEESGHNRVPYFCDPCWSGIRPMGGPFCPVCGEPFRSPWTLAYSPNHHCGECRRRVPFFDRIITPYAYEGTLARGIALFKAGRKTALVNALASLAFPFAAELRVAEIIIPVPLHPARLRAREFNQSLLLGDALARILNKPVKAHLLVKSGVTGLQKKLGRSDRQKNLKNSFELLNKAEIRGKSILLVDDVYTTGSTMNECAKVLKKGGSGPVTGYAVARTMLKPVR